MVTRPKGPTIADLRMEFVARAGAGAALLVVAASFMYSYAQLVWVSDQLGVHPSWLNYAFPFIIDLPAAIASALTVAMHTHPFRQRLYAWTILVIFTGLSWLANAVHSLTHSTFTHGHPVFNGSAVLAVLIAGMPPIGTVMGMHLWSFALRHSTIAEAGTLFAAQPARTPAPVVRATPQPVARAIVAPAPAPARAPIEAPEPSAQPEPEPVRSPRKEMQAQARILFDQAIAEDPTVRPNSAQIHATLGANHNPSTTRRWVQDWWDDMDPSARIAAELDAVGPDRPEIDLIPAVEDSESKTA